MAETYQSIYTGNQIDEGVGKALNEIGNLSNLNTTAKGTLVAAVNETKASIPTAVSKLTNDSGYATREEVSDAIHTEFEIKLGNYPMTPDVEAMIEEAKTEIEGDMPTTLPNPNALTINGTTYDGSKPVSVNITGGGGGGSAEVYDTRGVMPEPVTVTVPESPEVSLNLVAGQEYTVSYDGVEYSCVACAHEDYVTLGFPTYYDSGNHEPFELYQVDDGNGGYEWVLGCHDRTEGTVEWAICEGGLKKLDHKYLDYGPRETLLCSADVTFSTNTGTSAPSGGAMNKTAVGLDYDALEDGQTYNVYIGDAKYVMTCETRTDDGEYKVLTEAYPTIDASMTVLKVNSAEGYNDVFIYKPSEVEGTYPVRICKIVYETIPEEYLPDGIGGGSGGGTSDAVQYVEQTLTEEQQTQVRENLGLYREEPALKTVVGEWVAMDADTDGDGTVDAKQLGFMLAAPIGLEIGKTYTVEWDGTEYKTTCVDITGSGTPAALGNTVIFGGEDNGLPFVVTEFDAEYTAEVGNYGVVCDIAFAEVHDFSIIGDTVVHPIEPKFLSSLEWIAAPNVNREELMPKTELAFSDNSYRIDSYLDIDRFVPGERYEVVWDGVRYELEAKTISDEFCYYEYLADEDVTVGTELELVPTGRFAIATVLNRNTMIFAFAYLPASETETHTLSVKSLSNEHKPLPPQYLPNGVPYVAEDKVKTIVAEKTFQFANNMSFEYVLWPFVVGDTYTVTWDGVAYKCVCKPSTFNGMDVVGLGNVAIFGGGEDTGEPFAVGVIATADACQSGLITTDNNSHTVSITKLVPDVRPLDTKLLQYVEWNATNEKEVSPEQRILFSRQASNDTVNLNCYLGYIYDWSPSESDELFLYVDGERIPLKCALSTSDSVDGSYFFYTDTGIIEAGNYAIFVMLETSVVQVKIPGDTAGYHTIKVTKKEIAPLPEKYFPEEIGSFVMRSSTEGSTKRFKVTVDDSGTLTATEIT